MHIHTQNTILKSEHLFSCDFYYCGIVICERNSKRPLHGLNTSLFWGTCSKYFQQHKYTHVPVNEEVIQFLSSILNDMVIFDSLRKQILIFHMLFSALLRAMCLFLMSMTLKNVFLDFFPCISYRSKDKIVHYKICR